MWWAGWGCPLLGSDVWTEAWMKWGSEPGEYREKYFPEAWGKTHGWDLCQRKCGTCAHSGTYWTLMCQALCTRYPVSTHCAWWAPLLGPPWTRRNRGSKKLKDLTPHFTPGKWQTWDSSLDPRAWVVPQGLGPASRGQCGGSPCSIGPSAELGQEMARQDPVEL